MAISCGLNRAVIEISPGREGKTTLFGRFAATDDQSWTPRDRDKVYLRGVGSMDDEVEVRKGGRATGDTVGKIEFAYPFVHFDNSPHRTREWVVVTSQFDPWFFARVGDSGAPVVSRFASKVVGFILGGTYGHPIGLIGHENLGNVFVTIMSDASFVMERIASKLGRKIEFVVEDVSMMEGLMPRTFESLFMR